MPFEKCLKDGPDCFICPRRPFLPTLQPSGPPCGHAAALTPLLAHAAPATHTPCAPLMLFPAPVLQEAFLGF